jgi:RimJ/RimL family protein N-acetyltransferase
MLPLCLIVGCKNCTMATLPAPCHAFIGDISNASRNEAGQLVVKELPTKWKSAKLPSMRTLTGRFCRLEKLDPAAHSTALFDANLLDKTGSVWTYSTPGPFHEDPKGFTAWMEHAAKTRFTYTIFDIKSNKPVGVASFCHERAEDGVIEVGFLRFFPGLQRTPASTEAHYLLMKEAFDVLGYRRYEWRCDKLNEASFNAALRLGFVYEGTLRQFQVVRDRNRDMACLSILESEWPRIKQQLERWLLPTNFEANGRQRIPLQSML